MCWRYQVQFPAETLRFEACTCAMQEALRRYCPGKCKVMASQLDLPYLMPLSVAGCGLLKLGSVHWATAVALLQVVNSHLIHILFWGAPGHR